MTRRTKIVATIGPASSSPEVLGDLIDAGVDIARLNCSHGAIEDHMRMVEIFRAEAAKRNKVVAVLADLPGPKIRTTSMPEGFLFTEGTIVEMRSGSEPSAVPNIYTDYPTLSQDLVVGDLVTLGDSGTDLRVVEIDGLTVKAQVLSGGFLQGRPGLHLPADRVTLPVPTGEDRHLLADFAVRANVDFVAVSFVRDAEEIRFVKKLLDDSGIRVVAKIETPTALENLEEIVMESDVVMVARGDLGTECPFEDVPVYQKRIIRECLAHATPVITATQMMESMITAATPTRAEASDVANAVCDGTDAIMLSGETAVGHDPALVVRSMARIADAAEIVADFDRFAHALIPDRHVNSITAALTHGAWYAMNDANVKAVLCCTRSGATAHAMAALRPDAKLIALSSQAQTVRQMALTWGVLPLQVSETTNSDAMVAEAEAAVKAAGFVEPGDVVAILSGSRDESGATDSLRLITIQ